MKEKELRQIYDSRAWRRKRLEILQRDLFECQDCRDRLERANKEGIALSGEDRKIRRAKEVHHIKELRDHPELAFDDDNLISLCTQCHNLRHGRHKYKFCKKQKPLTEEKW